MKLANVEEMREIEQLTDAGGQSYAAMMEQAGWSVATLASVMQLAVAPDRVLVLVGPGNNGGDGLVAAHYLREAECEVTIYIWKREIKGDKNFSRLKRRKRGVTILWSDNDPNFANLREEVHQTDLVIDALLGTGVTRPIDGRLAALLAVVKQELSILSEAAIPTPETAGPAIPRFPLIEELGAPAMPAEAWPGPHGQRSPSPFSMGVQGAPRYPSVLDLMLLPPNLSPEAELSDEGYWFDEDEDILPATMPWPALPVVAVDCPSGLNCDTGALDPAAIPASLTVTFAYPKWGQVQFPGAGACGLLGVVDIGVPAGLGEELRVELVERASVRELLPARPLDANKGTFGKVMVVGGSSLYTGAPALSGATAARAGAGLVTVALPHELHPILAGNLLELTWLPLPSVDGTLTPAGVARLLERLKSYNALLVGPGLTTEAAARDFLDQLLAPGALAADSWTGRAVFDADALNILATLERWVARLPPGSVLTPHPGEMSRLTGLSIAEINGNRIATARLYAAEWGHIVLLKGAHTVIAHPDGRAAVLPFVEPALAKAGSGDVLAGAIVALVAQGLGAFEAAVCGGYIHGLSGRLADQSFGAAGSTARELVLSIGAAQVALTSSNN